MSHSLVQIEPSHPDHVRMLDGSGLIAYFNRLCDRIEGLDSKIHVFVPGTYDRKKVLIKVNALLEAYHHPDDRPPLFGLPIGIKDIFRCDGFQTSCGSLLPPVLFEGREATCVRRLKAAGAVVMGKTITTEFAYFEAGPTRNPWNLGHTPGGSSSGSAAGVAAGFFAWALGTQTIGSVIRPAAYCGITGFKPSWGRIPTDGVIPFSQTVDHVGLFSGSPEGLDALLSVMDSAWREDNRSPAEETCTLAVPVGRYLMQAESEGRGLFDHILKRLKAAGISVREVSALDDIDAINDRHQKLITLEMAQVHEPWFEAYRHLYRPRTVEIIEKGRRLAGKDIVSLRASCRELRQRLANEMQAQGVTAWISPSATGEAPAGFAATGSPLMNLPWTHAGLPVITLPAGRGPRGLPLGIQMVGNFMQDQKLLRTAKAIEKILENE